MDASSTFTDFRQAFREVYSYLLFKILHRYDFLDLSHRVVLQGTHYFSIGEYADLWVGRMSDKQVAVKVLRGGSSSNPNFPPKSKDRLVNNAWIWQYLKHPNVSEFYGLAFNFGYMPALILPFYGNATVVEYVKEKDNEIKLDMVKQIAQGLDYLHEQSIVHGDLRGSNIIVDGEGYPRICDYGLAFIIDPSEFPSIKTAGACRWDAPEIVNPPDTMSLDDSLALFTTESDVYAFAMTVLEVFTGKIPFYQKRNDSSVIFTVLNGGRPEFPPCLDERKDLRELVRDCWHEEPSRRPTSRVVNNRLNVGTSEDNRVSGGENQPPGWFESLD